MNSYHLKIDNEIKNEIEHAKASVHSAIGENVWYYLSNHVYYEVNMNVYKRLRGGVYECMR